MIPTRENSSPNSPIVDATMDPTISFGHELIHAHHFIRPGNYSKIQEAPHQFSEGQTVWREEIELREHRAVGFGYNKPGDITENQLRRELGMNPRASYSDRNGWTLVSR